MRRIRSAAIVSVAAALLFLAVSACRPPTGPSHNKPPSAYTPTMLSDTYSGSGDEVILVSTSGNVELSYSLHSLSDQDVYFVLTNTTASAAVDNPWVTGSSGIVRPRAVARTTSPSSGEIFSMAPTPPEIERFNGDPFGRRGAASLPGARASVLPPTPAPAFYIEGDEGSLFGGDESAVSATVRKIASADTAFGTKSLVIWVDDNLWSDTPLSGKVSPLMVSALAEQFLTPGSNNDICDWVTGIFGDEWGPHSEPYLIDDNGEIHILLYDIDGDELPTQGGSRVFGFFWARDNFYRTSSGSSLDYSNERIMFYLDAPIFAHDSDGDGTWEILEDYGPSAMLSVMAHEYQHMIHFYQKFIVNQATGSYELWLDEMASMVSEDFVSRHLGIDGPRGIDSSDGTAGSQYINSGRLPLFVATNDTSVTDWQEGEDVLKSYSAAYAFGAYLARNFGGPLFFRHLVQCSETGRGAVEHALTQGGYNDSFEQILRKWGSAVLLSDNTAMQDTGIEYNRDGWFSSSLDDIDYDLGSINMYNYQYGSQYGPYIYSGDGRIGPADGQQPASNLLFLAGLDLSGTGTWTVWLPDPVKLTVVIKE